MYSERSDEQQVLVLPHIRDNPGIWECDRAFRASRMSVNCSPERRKSFMSGSSSNGSGHFFTSRLRVGKAKGVAGKPCLVSSMLVRSDVHRLEKDIGDNNPVALRRLWHTHGVGSKQQIGCQQESSDQP